MFATGGFVVFALIPSSIFMFIEGPVKNLEDWWHWWDYVTNTVDKSSDFTTNRLDIFWIILLLCDNTYNNRIWRLHTRLHFTKPFGQCDVSSFLYDLARLIFWSHIEEIQISFDKPREYFILYNDKDQTQIIFGLAYFSGVVSWVQERLRQQSHFYSVRTALAADINGR